MPGGQPPVPCLLRIHRQTDRVHRQKNRLQNLLQCRELMESVPVWQLLFAGSHGAVNWLMLHGKGSRAYEHTLPTKKQQQMVHLLCAHILKCLLACLTPRNFYNLLKS